MDITAPYDDSPPGFEPLHGKHQDPEPPLPSMPQLIQVNRVRGTSFDLLIDGQPFPYQIGGLRVDLDPGGYSVVEVAILCERLELIDAPHPTPPEPEHVEVPDAIGMLVAGIARDFPAITYHAEDPNRAAIEQQARQLGLGCVPSDTIEYRTIKGVQGGR